MDKSKQKKFDVIKNKVQNAKHNNLQARPNRSRLVTLIESNKLLQDIERSKITYEEALERMTNISKMLKMLKKLDSFTQNQTRVLNALFMEDEIFTRISKTLEENDEGKLEIFEEK